MNGSRDERLLMRQRGAGTRQIKNSGFDLILPGQAKTPLKPQTSSKVQKTPRQRLAPIKSSRRTPKVSKAANTSTPNKVAKDFSKQSEGIQDEDVLLVSNVAESKPEITNKKRKLAGNAQNGRDKKRPKTSCKNFQDTKVVKRGRPTNSKSVTTASNPKAAAKGVQAEDDFEDELNSLLRSDDIEALEPQEQALYQQSNHRANLIKSDTNEQELKSDNIRLPEKRKPVVKRKTRKDAKTLGHEDTLLAATSEIEKGSRGLAPAKRRKKIGLVEQSSTSAEKRSSNQSKGNSETLQSSSLSQLDIARPVFGPGARSPKAVRAHDEPIQYAEAAGPSVLDQNSIQTVVETGEAATAQAQEEPQPKQKPRKKRAPTAQTRKPKEPLQKDSKTRVPALLSDTEAAPTIAPVVAAKEPERRPRKPLANITNVAKDSKAETAKGVRKGNIVLTDPHEVLKQGAPLLKIRQAPEPNPCAAEQEGPHKSETSTAPPEVTEAIPGAVHPKKRGRPRKEAPIAPSQADKTVAPEAKPLRRVTKHRNKPTKPMNVSLPITVYRPVSSTAADSDSDPISLSSYYPPKTNPNAIDVLAQASSEILEKQMNKEDVTAEEKQHLKEYAAELSKRLGEMSALTDENKALRRALNQTRKDARELRRELDVGKARSDKKGQKKQARKEAVVADDEKDEL